MTDASSDWNIARASADERTARLEQQLNAAQQITHIGSWEWDVDADTVSWSDELYRIYGLAPQSCEMTLERFFGFVHPDDRERVQAGIRRAIERGGRFFWSERIVRPDGSTRDLQTVGEVIADERGRSVSLIGTCRDVTDELRAQRLQAAEQRVLELIAGDEPLSSILTSIVTMIEEQAPGAIGSIVLLDATGRHLRHGAAPNLPEEYVRALDGLPVDALIGSCCRAMQERRPVIVTDTESDELWETHRELARRHGLRACWSTPFYASNGRVLGAFALYYREPREPSAAEFELVARATHVAGIAVERKQLDDQLRALLSHIDRVREDERAGIAREIHDELGQTLTALKMDLVWVAQRLPGASGANAPALVDKLQDMAGMTDATIERVRRISSELRPGVLDDLGLLAAIEWQGQEFERRTGTEFALESNVADGPLDRDLATALFRIFQEALTNVMRHARASRVHVQLREQDDRLRLSLRDNGRGTAPGALISPESLGLIGMHERARRLGGTVAVSSSEGGGTLVVVEVPRSAGGAP